MVGTAGTTSRHTAASDVDLDVEIEALADALRDGGPTGRDELRLRLDAQRWGPGRFRSALDEAVREGRVARGPGNTYSAPTTTAGAPGDGGARTP